MTKITLNISDKSYVLLEPNLHDGRLVGISLELEGHLELTVLDVRGKKYRIVLGGVSRFCAMDFWEGNIIFDFIVMKSENVRMDDLAWLGQNSQLTEEYLKDIYEQILRESLYVVELSSSYGCSLVGVAKDVSVFRYDGCQSAER